ncbi:hypothetical protein [Roseinatronobacter alkalisoli]|uniref:Uncharacterized protein n=1 Tax=Roseinatronobacter alkalisoli TaxID=3028235 RepID=A0ABT5TFM2_9RHOB|nr:hypothetical protein [Roseinatronobacter sp. HJB301]MDD7973933.1 hypothetical protein [Roseinatronobacter sp. HJB301]
MADVTVADVRSVLIPGRVIQLLEGRQAITRRLTMISEDTDGWHNYSIMPIFAHLYLEDSYVLGIVSFGDIIEFQMEFVLHEDHPFYCDPKPDEQYCYKRGGLKFSNIRSLKEFVRTDVKAVDATGEVDFGNIDSFVCRNHRYVLEGEWGKLDIESDEPTITYI